jgi:hypothetical protein
MNLDRSSRSIKLNLVIVTDLGLLRAYRVAQSCMDRQPHLELIEELRPEAAHQKISDQMSDQAGRFAKGGGPGSVPGDLSAGEQHDCKLEQRRRLIRLLADKMNTLLSDESVGRCSLAASAPIHLQLLDALSGPSRAKIATLLALDLTKTDSAELLKHFQL